MCELPVRILATVTSHGKPQQYGSYPIDRLSQKSGKYLKRKILALLTFSFPFKSKMRARKISKTWGAKSKFRSQNLTTKLTQTKTARGSLAEISTKLPLKLLPNCLTLVSSFKVPKDKTATKLLFVFGGVFVDNTNTHGQSHTHIHTSASYIYIYYDTHNTHTHTQHNTHNTTHNTQHTHTHNTDLHTTTPEICSKIHFQHTDKRVAVSAGHRSSLEAVSLAALLSRIRFGGKFSL